MNDQPDQIAMMTSRLRMAMFDAIKEADVTQIMNKMVEKAKEGDPAAVKTIMDYMLGGKTTVQNVNVQRLSLSAQVRQQEEDDQVDRTVKQIERVEPQAERLHRLLSMVMDRAPDVNQLVVLGENQLEQAERWATAQAAAMRQVAKGKKDVIWPDKPSFL